MASQVAGPCPPEPSVAHTAVAPVRSTAKANLLTEARAAGALAFVPDPSVPPSQGSPIIRQPGCRVAAVPPDACG